MGLELSERVKARWVPIAENGNGISVLVSENGNMAGFEFLRMATGTHLLSNMNVNWSFSTYSYTIRCTITLSLYNQIFFTLAFRPIRQISWFATLTLRRFGLQVQAMRFSVLSLFYRFSTSNGFKPAANFIHFSIFNATISHIEMSSIDIFFNLSF